MKKALIITFILLLSFTNVYTEMSIEERNFLYNKYVKEINFNKKDLMYTKTISNKYTS